MPDDVPLSADYRMFGKGARLTDIIPQESDRAIFASMAGVQRVDGTSLAEWIYTLLTLYSDPTGQTAARPLMPMTSGRLGACGIVKQFDLAMPEAAKVIANIQQDYRDLRIASLDGKLGDGQQHLRVLDAWKDQYKLTAQQATDLFIPADLPKEAPIPHATSIHDDFTRANSTGLGTATVGSVSQGWSWTSYNVDSTPTVTAANRFDIASNVALINPLSVTDYGIVRAGGALSSSNHYAQVTTSVVGTSGNNKQQGPVVRFKTGTDATSYMFRAVPLGNLGFYLDKNASNGATTNITSTTSTQVASGKILKLTANGSVLTADYDGSNLFTITDTTISGNVNCGMYAFSNSGSPPGISNSDFQAADLAASGYGQLTHGGALTHGALIHGGRLAA